MDFETFSHRAEEVAAAIPSEFMEGIERVDVHRDAKSHPYLADVWTLGECETSPLSDPTGTEPFRSVVHVYYGSFVALARAEPGFDFEAELQETIEHEIQHHIEDRAGAKSLLDEDGLFEAHARFRAGLDVPAGWYRMGEPLAPSLWAVDLDLFLELEMRKPAFESLRGRRLALDVLDAPLEVDVPSDAQPDEIWTFEGLGLFEPESEEPDEGEEEPGEDEPGLAGDLHVVPVVH